MLGKLLKHEWIRLWKIPTFLLILLQIMALGAGLTFLEPVFYSGAEGVQAIIVLVWCTFGVAVIGVALGTYIYLALQFYKSTYSDEGYLTHTLPVTPRQILVSKILIMALWQCIAVLGIMLAVSVFILVSSFCLGENPADWIARIRNVIHNYGTKEWINCFFAVIINGITGVFYSGVWITASVTIGQMVKKHRIAAAFGAACLLSFIVSFFQNMIRLPFIGTYSTTVTDFIMSGIWSGTVLNVISAVVLYIISEYLLRHKLNLE